MNRHRRKVKYDIRDPAQAELLKRSVEVLRAWGNRSAELDAPEIQANEEKQKSEGKAKRKSDGEWMRRLTEWLNSETDADFDTGEASPSVTEAPPQEPRGFREVRQTMAAATFGLTDEQYRALRHDLYRRLLAP